MAERELVRCGCGVVRMLDVDAETLGLKGDSRLAILAPLAIPDHYAPALARFEAPRICRQCGCLYMLPKPSAPESL